MNNREIIDKYADAMALSFGKEVSIMRQARGMNRSQLAREALVSYKWIVAIESGKRMPSPYVIISITLALNFYDWDFMKLKKV